jgi:hypothetical protein
LLQLVVVEVNLDSLQLGLLEGVFPEVLEEMILQMEHMHV